MAQFWKAPSWLEAVYPYPIDHPLDSFAMVDLEHPASQLKACLVVQASYSPCDRRTTNPLRKVTLVMWECFKMIPNGHFHLFPMYPMGV